MRVKPNSRGQTLVETAMVLPLFGILIFAVVWLICFGHNAIVLQKMALDQARVVTADPAAVLVFTSGNHERLWGQTTRPLPQRNSALPVVWRPFIPTWLPVFTPTVQKEKGRFINVRYKTMQTGRGAWSRLFRPKLLSIGAETFVEPPTPPNS